MYNKKLSISIPTFNRHEILFENLQLILPELALYSIAVYISDDSDNDHTKDIIKKLSETHPFIYYVKNNPSLGHDKNILSTLQLPNTQYIWLLGDSVIIKKGSISKLLDILTTEYDFVFVNSYVKDSENISKIDDLLNFLTCYSWYLTLTGATIYNTNTVKAFNAQHKVKQYRNFQQLAIILSYVSSSTCRAYWISETLISCNQKKKSYWTRNVIDVFVNDWSFLIKSFPQVFRSETIINEVIYSHSKNVNIFTLTNLIWFRSAGAIDLISVLSNYKPIKIAARNQTLLFLIVSLIPKSILLAAKKALKSSLT